MHFSTPEKYQKLKDSSELITPQNNLPKFVKIAELPQKRLGKVHRIGESKTVFLVFYKKTGARNSRARVFQKEIRARGFFKKKFGVWWGPDLRRLFYFVFFEFRGLVGTRLAAALLYLVNRYFL